MNLKKLQDKISQYKTYLESENCHRELYKWESIKYFQEHWNTEADDLHAMYNASLNNLTSRRQWKGRDFFPKEMMLKFIKAEPEYVRLAFRDLFNESKGVDGRVDRFLFYCEELLKIYKEKFPHAKENDHYHTHKVVMMYLTNRYPENHTLYRFKDFRRFLESVDAKNISSSHDLERYAKVTKTIGTFLNKDEEIISLSNARLEDNHYQGENRLMIHEFLIVTNRA